MSEEININDLPILTRKEAKEQRVEIFKIKGPACYLCKSKVFGLDKETNTCFCVTCKEDKESGYSAGAIKAHGNKHNKKVCKKIKELWVIPNTYGGLNTVKK